VAHSFRSDQNLRELIEGNIEARGGTVLPIEDRMLSSIERRLAQAGVSLDEIPRSPRETWGGSVRDKLRQLEMEDVYQGAFAGPSAYTHGNWHELVIYHLGEKRLATGATSTARSVWSCPARRLPGVYAGAQPR
jgi:hypothetical protein